MKCYKHTHRVGGKSDPEVEHYHCVECNTTQPAVQPAEVSETGGVTEAGLDVVEVSRECSWCNRPSKEKEEQNETTTEEDSAQDHEELH